MDRGVDRAGTARTHDRETRLKAARLLGQLLARARAMLAGGAEVEPSALSAAMRPYWKERNLAGVHVYQAFDGWHAEVAFKNIPDGLAPTAAALAHRPCASEAEALERAKEWLATVLAADAKDVRGACRQRRANGRSVSTGLSFGWRRGSSPPRPGRRRSRGSRPTARRPGCTSCSPRTFRPGSRGRGKARCTPAAGCSTWAGSGCCWRTGRRNSSARALVIELLTLAVGFGGSDLSTSARASRCVASPKSPPTPSPGPPSLREG